MTRPQKTEAPKKKKRPGNKKIVRYRKPLNFNIGIAVFCVIFIYLVIVTVQYLVRPRVKMYEVTYGDIANQSHYTGMILREENIVHTPYAGYVNYYQREKQKTAMGNLVYTVDETGAMTEYLSSNAAAVNKLSPENLKELKSILSTFSGDYEDSSFYKVYETNVTLNSVLMEYVNVGALEELNSTDGTIAFQKCSADCGGIVVYSMDGYEGMQPEQITAEMFSKDNYTKTVFSGGQQKAVGDAVFKMITDDAWSILFPISEKELEYYQGLNSVYVEFSDRNIETTADFSLITGADGGTYGKLGLNKYMIQFAGDRFINIEVKKDTLNGLKIPQSAITTMESYVVPARYLTTGGNSSSEGFQVLVYNNDGSTTVRFVVPTIMKELSAEESPDGTAYVYVDTSDFSDGDTLVLLDSNEQYQIAKKEVLEGVFNINHGYAVFKYIERLDENKDYVIAKKNVGYSVRCYDHLALDASTVSNSDILR